MITPWQWLVTPTKTMTAAVMTTTEGDQVAVAGRTPLRPRETVVQVTVRGGSPTTGEDAGGVTSLHESSRLLPRSSPSHPGVDRHARLGIGDHKRPLAVSLFSGHLAGDVRDHRPDPQKLSGSLGEARKGLQVDPELDSSSSPLSLSLRLPQQQIQ